MTHLLHHLIEDIAAMKEVNIKAVPCHAQSRQAQAPFHLIDAIRLISITIIPLSTLAWRISLALMSKVK